MSNDENSLRKKDTEAQGPADHGTDNILKQQEQNLQNGMSCHSSQFWHYHKPPAMGLLQWFDLPANP